MADFPYSPNPASVGRFFSHVQSAGVPEKVTLKYLEKVGFKSKNDRYLLQILKFVGFLDNSGAPTVTWQAYRRKDTAGQVLAEAIRKAYGDLFKTFPDAHRKDNEALRNYFSAHTTVAASVLGLIVRTFKALVEAANFEAAGPIELPASEPSVRDRAPRAGASPSVVPATSGISTVNINIQLELPATDDASVYEKLFAALKKHLLSS